MIRGKQTDALMRYLRDKKGIAISGSKQKKELLSMGYYHGYKGYRYLKTPSNQIRYTDFEQLSAVYNFDMNLKTIFYPLIMTLETALKNYTLDTLISFGEVDLENAFKNFLNDYKSEQTGSNAYIRKMQDHLKLKKKIHNEISYKYSSDNVITHFLDNKDSIPLWAVFEIMDMGVFGLFLKCLNEPIRQKVCDNLKISHTSTVQQDGRLAQNIIFTLKELRNPLAHNNVIFDCRFQNNTKTTRNVKSYVTLETGIANVEFKFIVDYLILLVILLKKIGKTKTELKRTVKQFRDQIEELRFSVPASLWAGIAGTGIKPKLTALESYISRS